MTFERFWTVFELWGPRNTYTDAKFDGEFIPDVCFLFRQRLIDGKLKPNSKVLHEELFSDQSWMLFLNYCDSLKKLHVLSFIPE